MACVVAYYTHETTLNDNPMYKSFFRFVMNYIRCIGYYCDPLVWMMMGSPTVSLINNDTSNAAKGILIYDHMEDRVNMKVFYSILQKEYRDKTNNLAVICVVSGNYLSFLDRQKTEGTPEEQEGGPVRITLIPLFNTPNLFTEYHVKPLKDQSDRLFEFCFDYPFPHHLKAMALMPLLLM